MIMHVMLLVPIGLSTAVFTIQCSVHIILHLVGCKCCIFSVAGTKSCLDVEDCARLMCAGTPYTTLITCRVKAQHHSSRHLTARTKLMCVTAVEPSGACANTWNVTVQIKFTLLLILRWLASLTDLCMAVA